MNLPPAQTKKEELKKFAKQKPFKSEAKNNEFIDWAKENFSTLKSEYASARKAKTAPDGTGDFQDFALYKYREYIKAQKEKEMETDTNSGEIEPPNDTTQADSNGNDSSQDSPDENEPEENQAKEESDEEDDDDGDLDSLISFIKSNMKKEE
jgi:hypothetical protein